MPPIVLLDATPPRGPRRDRADTAHVRGPIGVFRSRPERGPRLPLGPDDPASALTWYARAAATSACGVAARDG